MQQTYTNTYIYSSEKLLWATESLANSCNAWQCNNGHLKWIFSRNRLENKEKNYQLINCIRCFTLQCGKFQCEFALSFLFSWIVIFGALFRSRREKYYTIALNSQSRVKNASIDTESALNSKLNRRQ